MYSLPTRVSAAVTAIVALVAMPAAAPALTIDFLQGDGFASRPAASAALARAAAQWTGALTDPITVTIATDFFAFTDGSVLGSASTRLLTTANDGFDLVRDALVADAGNEPDDAIVASLPDAAGFTANLPAGFTLNGELSGAKANFKALGFSGLDATFGATDATINFNSDFEFDFDNRDGVAATAVDFETVAAHEIGHALGFISAVDQVEAAAPGAVSPRLLDLFRFPAGGVPASAVELTTLPRELRPGAAAVTGDTAVAYAMSTGSTAAGGDGNQASHFKADELTGVHLGLLDPTLARGEAFTVSAADLRALDLIGYEVAAIPLPPAWALLAGALALLAGRGGRAPVLRAPPRPGGTR